MKEALGIIETIGLVSAIQAADIAVKAANVELIGYELTKGDGMTVVKITGNVGAVNASVSAVRASIKAESIYSVKVIPRPSEALDELIFNSLTVGCDSEKASKLDRNETTLADISETHLQIEEILEIDEEDQIESEICNICNDPLCTRKKGDLKRRCIHYFDKN